MKRLAVVLIVAMLLIVLLPVSSQGDFYARFCAGGGGTAPGETCDEIIGWATFTNDADNLYIRMWTRAGLGWCFEDAHVQIVTDLADVPVTAGGCPKIGKFEIKREFDPCTSSVNLTIPLKDEWPIGTELFSLLHISAINTMRDWQETAWATTCGSLGDNQFPGCANWSAYTWYELR